MLMLLLTMIILMMSTVPINHDGESHQVAQILTIAKRPIQEVELVVLADKQIRDSILSPSKT